MEYARDNFTQQRSLDQEFELFKIRRLAFSILKFFPERIKFRDGTILKETTLFSIPTYDKYMEVKPVLDRDERIRVWNRFKKINGN